MLKNGYLAAIAAMAFLTAGCGGGGGGLDGTQTASLSVGVTDAPVDDAEAVVVTFTAIELLDGDDQVRQSFVFDEPVSVDLLEQQGDRQFFLIQDRQVPVGVYEQIRLIVDGPTSANCNAVQSNPDHPNYITVDGVDYPLIVPSGAQTGLKIQGPITLAAGGSAAYTVDFDLRKSIAERGVTGCYNLRPVLRVVDNAAVGTLVGEVDPALLADASCTSDPVSGVGAAVYVFSGAGQTPDDFDGSDPESLTTALLQPEPGVGVPQSFTYEVGFLLEGDYTVALSCQAGDDAPAPVDDDIEFILPADVLVVAGEATQVDF
ncbi:DUF4382 domain-containing protein [Panacagrimonas sp.]|uniref:DUF4382 domain-containing protein n=1 Tax=Panacagrimonas sp. TaxID=2480088 RepID=UPI003B5203F6